MQLAGVLLLQLWMMALIWKHEDLASNIYYKRVMIQNNFNLPACHTEIMGLIVQVLPLLLGTME